MISYCERLTHLSQFTSLGLEYENVIRVTQVFVKKGIYEIQPQGNQKGALLSLCGIEIEGICVKRSSNVSH